MFDESDPRHPEARKKVLNGKLNEYAKIKAMVEAQCDAIRTANKDKVSGTKADPYTLSGQMNSQNSCTVRWPVSFCHPQTIFCADMDGSAETLARGLQMDEAMLRKKHTQIQKKKNDRGKTGHSWLGKRGIGGKRRFAGVKMS